LSWREFISSLAGSLAWPIALCLIAIIFRQQIRHLLTGNHNVKRIKAGLIKWQYWDQTTSKSIQELSHPRPESEDEEVWEDADSGDIREGFEAERNPLDKRAGIRPTLLRPIALL
jgi:hypothetical protein